MGFHYLNSKILSNLLNLKCLMLYTESIYKTCWEFHIGDEQSFFQRKPVN